MAESKTAFEQYADKIPLEREVHLVMIADSSDEVGVEIDTDIPAGSKLGWIMYGMRWQIRTIASPHLPVGIPPDASNLFMIQLCRGELPATPVLLEPGDESLVMEEIVDVPFNSAVGFALNSWPRTIRKPAVTQLSKLYLMFQTGVDSVPISAATIEVYAEILYHLVKAPSAPRERV